MNICTRCKGTTDQQLIRDGHAVCRCDTRTVDWLNAHSTTLVNKRLNHLREASRKPSK